MSVVERARELRAMIEESAQALPEEKAREFPELFPEWKGDGREYAAGILVRRDGTLYRVLIAHAAQSDWPPEDSPSLFAKLLTDPAGVVLPWAQPESTNAYQSGDRVSHNGKVWVSLYDNNVWEPGIFGWEEV